MLAHFPFSYPYMCVMWQKEEEKTPVEDEPGMELVA